MSVILRLFGLIAVLAVCIDCASPIATAYAASPQKAESATRAQPFRAFVDRLWPIAQARGVSRETFSSAFAGLTPDQDVIDLTKKQSEFVKPIWEYLASAVSANRLERGSKLANVNSNTLDVIEQRFGVDREVVLGVWGMETNFGGFTGGKDIIRSLATLASVGYRGTYFRDELISALLILQQHHVVRADFKGSWAGAMGQTQFMPSSFQKFAVDFDGDGKKDIWTNVPDASGKTAPNRCFTESVRAADGHAMPRSGEANLFFPAGADGPAFLVTNNYDVIKRYNNSDAYALGVAMLGDRIYGASQLYGTWPVEDPILGLQQRIELQQALTSLGYDVGEPNGRIGSRTRDAIRDFQDKRGLRPDGYAGRRVLEALRVR
ncbi:MAG: lytic murein transglycosylase [Alphaproteobacteria bacterium]|nr:lytic murein transglycosylase [Alphaproteobacteria bacterium]